MSKYDEQLDQATRDRLAKLGSMPVDLSRLEQQMADALPPKTEPIPSPHRLYRTGWLRVAAVLALMIGIAGASYYAFFGVGPQTAVAQTMTVAELHESLLNDPQEAYLAYSIDQAQALIDAQLAGKQSLPIVDGTQVESCCLVEGEFPLRAALVIKQPNGTATIIIAQGEDFAQPMHPIEHPSGIELQGHDHAGMPMVMRNKDDLWMCVMGEADTETLADVAAAIKFEELRE
jgi:hypothetical protein